MQNLEVRIRLASEIRALPFAEIPLRLEVIQNVVPLIQAVGGVVGGLDLNEAPLSYQITDDGESAYLEVVVDDTDQS